MATTCTSNPNTCEHVFSNKLKQSTFRSPWYKGTIHHVIKYFLSFHLSEVFHASICLTVFKLELLKFKYCIQIF